MHQQTLSGFEQIADYGKYSPELDLASLLRTKLKVPDSLENLRARYRDARPFPHLILDNLFPDDVLQAVAADSRQPNGIDWAVIRTEGLEHVLRMRSGVDLGPASYQLAAFLHSPRFLYLISELTGIWQLLPDPYLQGGGHAAMRRGMHMQVHSDRSVAYDTGLTRRLAMIIFLNKDWKTDYAGELELWNHPGTRCEVSIAPVFNRTVLFEVADPNYHGVPTPLNCPAERTRQSFIVYYHTVGDKDGKHPSEHTSVFVPQAYRKQPKLATKIATNIVPPVLLRPLWRLWKAGKR
jgi:hypothetical protein